MFLCSAIGTTILVCFPVFLVLVDFWLSASILYVLFSMLCVCLLAAVEIAASFLWQAPAFLCVTNIFLFVIVHTFGTNSVNYATQKSTLQFRAFLRCEIQLLKETQELQGGWLPVVDEESAGKTLFFAACPRADGNDCRICRVLVLHKLGSLPSSELGALCPALSQAGAGQNLPPSLHTGGQ